MIISNSEAESYDTCPRAHYYKFALGLTPIRPAHVIRIGVVGHKVLEAYYRTGLVTKDKRQWYLAGMAQLEKYYDEAVDESDLEIVSLISDRFNKYIKHYPFDHQNWRIVDVEGRYSESLTDKIEYGMTLDLLVEVMIGPRRGQFLVIDHKFCYNFQTQDEISMNSQLPKYIKILRGQGFNVTRGVLNQVRYRNDIRDESKLFQRSELKPSDIRLDAIMAEQLTTAKIIYEQMQLPVAVYRDRVKRNLSKRNCGYCQFRLPCSNALDGRDRDESTVLAVEYTSSSYGYR